jgi:glycerol kinase
MTHILSIDQGTTSTRAILFDARLQPVAKAQEEFAQHFPAPGHVEHAPDDLWHSVLRCARAVIDRADIFASGIAAIGITNQRETTLLWDRATGQPLHRAIVWQDRRTAPICDRLRADGMEAGIAFKTGLVIDPYFSATKIAWLLDTIEGARARAARGEICFGTVDSWLIWQLTGGRTHVTDATNAARTMLYDIRRGAWDEDLCAALDIPMGVLPEVRDCAADFGTADPAHLGAAIPILGVAGDQQAATLGQACFAPGMVKATYGTGCFALLNTGDRLVESRNRLLGTVAWQIDGRVTYALEGAIFNAGTVVQWLRDGLGLIETAADSGKLATGADPAQRVIMVPAFTGLGAPWWDADCRGAIFGITRATGPAEFARAALESVGHQTRDLIDAMAADWPNGSAQVLRADGGFSASDPAMQFLADILGAPVDRPRMLETTALGVAWLAGMRAGVAPDMAGFARQWARDRRFAPAMAAEERAARHAAWTRAVAATRATPGQAG